METGRFTFIDGMRGVASLAVVFYHINGAVNLAHPNWAPHLVNTIFSFGWSGVQVFFVLSGFVIAYSIRAEHIDRRFFGRFAVRRMLRLDPPYIVSILLALGLSALSVVIFPDLHKEFPSWGAIAAHLFYLQELLGFGSIVDIYWTLCLEVQFYVLLVVLVGFAKRISSRQGQVNWTRSSAFFLLMAPLFILSLLQFFDYVELAPHGLFLPYWFYFVLGATAWWAVSGQLDIRVFIVAWLVTLSFFGVDWFRDQFDFGPLAALVASAALCAGGRMQKLGIWLADRVSQYLGTISYSLYLVHPILGWRAVSLFSRLLGPELTTSESIVAFTFGVAVSIVSAHVFYCFIERPSHEFSRRATIF